MIITRTPFRITLGGGGTDLPGYYSRHGGFVLSAALNKYMFIYLNTPIVDDLVRVKYSQSEIVEDVSELQHTLCREALRLFGIRRAIEVISMADIPAGTGLGSSSCYLVGLLNALHTLSRKPMSRQELAEEACHIELDVLKKPIGKQDQYLAAFGGITALHIDRTGAVEVESIIPNPETLEDLESRIVLFYTGLSRSTEEILALQTRDLQEDSSATASYYSQIKEIGLEIYTYLKRGNVRRFGEMLDEHWRAKKKLGAGVANPRIDRLYDVARANGALGGKISGAGGGGFFLFYAEEGKQELRRAMQAEGLREMRFRVDFDGSKILMDLLSGEQYRDHDVRQKAGAEESSKEKIANCR
jgi:D-glycero-alpha-D-manno-heptose-7-phosphate kinase